MQTNCPNCSNRLVLDDAKVPDTPFMLKCPKCQNTVKLPGKGAGKEQAPPPPAAQPQQGAAPVGSATSAAMAPPAPVTTPSAPPLGKVLVSLPSADQANAIGASLGRLGFAADPLDQEQLEEKILKLQQGEYPVVATSRNGVPDDRNLYRIVQMLPPEIRRRVFLLLIGDEFKTGEGTQAFAVLADLVIQGKDASNCERLIAQTMIERRRIYQTYWDAEERKAEGKL